MRPTRRQVVDAVAADQHVAGIGHGEPGQDTHKRGLAAARRPEQAKIFAVGTGERQALERAPAPRSACGYRGTGSPPLANRLRPMPSSRRLAPSAAKTCVRSAAKRSLIGAPSGGTRWEGTSALTRPAAVSAITTVLSPCGSSTATRPSRAATSSRRRVTMSSGRTPTRPGRRYRRLAAVRQLGG